MLETLRKNTKIVIWTVILAFALWGGFSVGTQFKKEGRFAGSVFGKNVTFQEFDRFYKASQIFNVSDKPMESADVIQQSAWQAVIFSRAAKQRGIEVTDQEVREQVYKILDQQKISRENYTQWIERALRQTPQQFEEQIRELLRIQKLMTSLTPPAQPISEEDAKNEYLRERNQMSVAFMTFKTQEEAKKFRNTLKKPEDWETETAKTPDNIKQTDLIPMEFIGIITSLAPEHTETIKQLEKGQFSEVLPFGPEFAVFYIRDKVLADENSFQLEKTQYTKELQERRQQEALILESRKIIADAKLENYLTTASPVAAS